jgi:hypothetical protein
MVLTSLRCGYLLTIGRVSIRTGQGRAAHTIGPFAPPCREAPAVRRTVVVGADDTAAAAVAVDHVITGERHRRS